MAIRRWISSRMLAAAVMLSAAVMASAQNIGPDAAAVDSQQNAAILTDRTSTAQARDQAAQRLVSRGTADANDVLLSVLNNAGNREARLAVAKALAGSANSAPNQQFIKPLSQLLGRDQDLTAAAARALSLYRDRAGEQARKELTQFVNDLQQPVPSRKAAIRAMTRVDKRTAEALVDLLGDKNPLICSAAIDALTDITGFRNFGSDLQKWRQWWTSSPKDEVVWATDLLNKKADRVGPLEAKVDADRIKMGELIDAIYQRAVGDEKAKAILPLLQSDAEDVRWAAVSVLHTDIGKIGGVNTSPDVLVGLRRMIADSAADVRKEAAQALALANDVTSVPTLLAQLTQEKDPDVQAEIFKALGPMHDLRAVEPLLRGLDSPSFGVAREAAGSLESLANGLREPANKAQAQAVSEKLLEKLKASRDPSAESLRESIVKALAALGQPSALLELQRLCVSDRESVRVRQAAVIGLGNIGSADSANTVVAVLRDADGGVRLCALDALAKIARYENAEAIGQLLSPANEKDSSVRERAWTVLSALLEKGNAQDMRHWADRFRNDTEEDHKRRLRVFQVLEKKIDASPSRDLADCRQNVGFELLRLDRPDEAVPEFRLALDYWKSVRNEPSADYVMQLLMESLLRGKKYAEAERFATGAITAAPANDATLWPKISGEFDRLKKAGDYDAILVMLEEMKKVPLAAVHQTQLASIEANVRELQKKKAANGARSWVRQEGRDEHAEVGHFVTA